MRCGAGRPHRSEQKRFLGSAAAEAACQIDSAHRGGRRRAENARRAAPPRRQIEARENTGTAPADREALQRVVDEARILGVTLPAFVDRHDPSRMDLRRPRRRAFHAGWSAAVRRDLAFGGAEQDHAARSRIRLEETAGSTRWRNRAVESVTSASKILNPAAASAQAIITPGPSPTPSDQAAARQSSGGDRSSCGSGTGTEILDRAKTDARGGSAPRTDALQELRRRQRLGAHEISRGKTGATSDTTERSDRRHQRRETISPACRERGIRSTPGSDGRRGLDAAGGCLTAIQHLTAQPRRGRSGPRFRGYAPAR